MFFHHPTLPLLSPHTPRDDYLRDAFNQWQVCFLGRMERGNLLGTDEGRLLCGLGPLREIGSARKLSFSAVSESGMRYKSGVYLSRFIHLLQDLNRSFQHSVFNLHDPCRNDAFPQPIRVNARGPVCAPPGDEGPWTSIWELLPSGSTGLTRSGIFVVSRIYPVVLTKPPPKTTSTRCK